MSLEITGISANGLAGVQNTSRRQPAAHTAASVQAAETRPAKPDPERAEQTIHAIERLSSYFNRRLKFSINRELDQVVVKVIDGETDKVIKVLPPEELQRLQVRIRETIGLLFDETI